MSIFPVWKDVVDKGLKCKNRLKNHFADGGHSKEKVSLIINPLQKFFEDKMTLAYCRLGGVSFQLGR